MIRGDRLEVLLAAASTGSFSGAAKLLFMTPSAVSQRVATLEREVGVALFERSRHGVRLTVAGQILHRHAQAVVNRLADARAEIDSLVSGETGRVVLGSFPTATAAFAAAAIARFHQDHPHVEVRLVDGEPSDSVLRLKQRELDLAVVFDMPSWPAYRSYDGRDVASPGDIDVVHLCDDPFLVMLPLDHRLTAKAELDLVDLRGESITVTTHEGAPWGADLRQVCGEAGFEPCLDPMYTSDDFQAQQALVAAGLGLSLLPTLAALNVRTDIALRPLRMGPVRRVVAAFPAGAYRATVTSALVVLIRGLAGEAVRTGQASPMDRAPSSARAIAHAALTSPM
jgi:DNA-binding transcriptional LysR family regulator